MHKKWAHEKDMAGSQDYIIHLWQLNFQAVSEGFLTVQLLSIQKNHVIEPDSTHCDLFLDVTSEHLSAPHHTGDLLHMASQLT